MIPVGSLLRCTSIATAGNLGFLYPRETGNSPRCGRGRGARAHVMTACFAMAAGAATDCPDGHRCLTGCPNQTRGARPNNLTVQCEPTHKTTWRFPLWI